MPSSGVANLDELLGGKGYPEKSAILVVGPPGVGKEALGYLFTSAGLSENNFCLYVTRLSTTEVLEDERGFRSHVAQQSPVWIARQGGEAKIQMNDLQQLVDQIRAYLDQNSSRTIRIVTDVLSSLLILNGAETVYKFIDVLIGEVKERNAVLVATLEEGMHSAETNAAMQQLFDGVIELSFYKTGLQILTLLRVVKMRGTTPHQDYYSVKFTRPGIELEPVNTGGGSAAPTQLLSTISTPESSAISILRSTEAKTVFEYLAKSFTGDYISNRLAIEQAGWRTRIEIAETTGIPTGSFYGREGKLGSLLKELLSSGIVEARFFPGQRGRGGEVIKLRVAYEKELVKRIVDSRIAKGGGSK